MRGRIGILPASAVGQRQRVVALHQRKVRVELQCQLEFGKCVIEAAGGEIDAAECGMGPRVLAIGGDSRQRRALGDRPRGRDIGPAEMHAEHVVGGEQGQRLTVVRIDRDCLLQQRLSGRAIRPRYPPVMRKRPHHQIPGVHAAGWLALAAEILRSIDLRLDCHHDGVGDLVLHGEHVDQLAIVMFRPDMAAGRGIVELRGDAHAIATLAYAAFDDVAHAELGGDLLDMHRLALVGERRVARDNEEPAQFRQRGDDVLADSVGKIRLVGSSLILLKGSTAIAGRSGKDSGGGCRFGGGFGRRRGQMEAVYLFVHGSNETKAFSRNGADQPLFPATIADRAAGGVDAAVECRIGHDPAAPYHGNEIVPADDMIAVLQ